MGITSSTYISRYLYLITMVDSLEKYKGGVEKMKIPCEGLEGWRM